MLTGGKTEMFLVCCLALLYFAICWSAKPTLNEDLLKNNVPIHTDQEKTKLRRK
jgi:hypothetical protein